MNTKCRYIPVLPLAITCASALQHRHDKLCQVSIPRNVADQAVDDLIVVGIAGQK